MRFFWNAKFIFWNFIILVFLKTAFVYSGFQLAALLQEPAVFTKQDIIASTNQFRASIDVAPLAENSVLDIAAAQKLQDMIDNQYFAHFSPSGVSPWHWFEVNQYTYSYAGENLAIGFPDAATTVQAWANSPSHRKNLANTNYLDIGVAVAPAKIKDIDGIAVVQMFGRPAVVKSAHTLRLGFSGTSASGGTAKDALRVSVAPSAVPAPSALEKPTVPIRVSSIANREVPVEVPTSEAPSPVRRIAEALNTVYTAYALIIAILSASYMFFAGFHRQHILKTAMNFALFFLALALPLIQISPSGFIF